MHLEVNKYCGGWQQANKLKIDFNIEIPSYGQRRSFK